MQQNYPVLLSDQAWLCGNIYFNLCCVQGRHAAMLIEVGVSSVVDAVVAQLDALPVAPDYLVVTHPHSDHLTGLDGLRMRYSEAAVIVGPGAVKFFTHPKAAQALVREDRFMADRLADWGWQAGRQPVNQPPAEAGAKVLQDSDTVDLGGRAIHFIETHGHSPGSLAAWVPELDLLVASDALGFRYLDGSFLPLFFTGAESYLKTLDRLAAYRPKILCLGHQGPLFGAAATDALEKARMAAETLVERVRSESASADALADELFREAYRDEMLLYSEKNIRNCVRLLIQRGRS